MKNKKILISMLMIFIISFACTEKDLDLKPTTENALTFYQQPENVITAIWSCYNSLIDRTGPWGNSHVMWGSIPSDDAYCGGENDQDMLSLHYADAYTSTPLDPAANLTTMMKENYKGIYAANLILDGVDPKTDIGTQAHAEAKFIKALNYFYMVRMFGGLALVKKTAGPNDKLPRATADETFAYIAQLLEEAIAYKLADGSSALPAKTGLGQIANSGRATLGSAQALLGKVYMYQKQYQKAIDVLSLIDANPAYKLENSYYQIFNPNRHSDEEIFQVNYTNTAPAAEPLGMGEIQLFGPRSVIESVINDTIARGWGFNQPTANLVNEYKKQNDNIRLNTTVISSDSLSTLSDIYYKPKLAELLADSLKSQTAWKKNHTVNGVVQTVQEAWDAKYKRIWVNTKDNFWDKKHMNNPKTTGSGGWTHKKYNLILLRLADVYLLLAEAYNQTGNDAKAQEYLNRVRSRVLLPPVTTSGSALLDAIKLERRLELALEGDRYFDLVRWGDAATVLGPLGYTTGTPGVATDGLFPIPQTEIDASGFTQNKGY